MAWAAVFVKGPENRRVYINGDNEPAGKTNKNYAVETGWNTFELKASRLGSAVSKTVDVAVKDPPMVVDLTPPASA